jgi:uncharacterized membrane protein YadS
VTVFLSCCIAEKSEDKGKFKLRIPWFIPGFLIAAALVTWLPFLRGAGGWIKEISKYLMILTLFLIGANLNRDKLKELGLRPVLLGVMLWLILGVSWCLAVYFGLVNCSIR